MRPEQTALSGKERVARGDISHNLANASACTQPEGNPYPYQRTPLLIILYLALGSILRN